MIDHQPAPALPETSTEHPHRRCQALTLKAVYDGGFFDTCSLPVVPGWNYCVVHLGKHNQPYRHPMEYK